MSRILSMGTGIDNTSVSDGTVDTSISEVTWVKTSKGAWTELALHHPALVVQLAETNFNIPEATQPINTGNITESTMYYCYYKLVDNVPTWVASTTDPDDEVPEVEDYVWIRKVLFKSIGGNVANTRLLLIVRNSVTYANFIHTVSDNSYSSPPTYVSGLAPTLSATGQVSTEAGKFFRLTRERSTRAAITNGYLLSVIGGENVANLELVTNYSTTDGSADPITAGKWFKALISVFSNDENDFDYLIEVCFKPAIEYATATAAWADDMEVLDNSALVTIRNGLIPIMYVVSQAGEAASAEMSDIRALGLVNAVGAAAGVSTHAGLAGLTNYADHPGYALIDGSRPFTGNITFTNGGTIDGVDVSVHAANTTIHHAPVTISAGVGGILGLSTQQLTLDTQVKNTILAGPTTGSDAEPAFRTLSHGDISDFHTQTAIDAAALDHAAVTLAASATPILGLSTQEISFDTQTASNVLAGPVVGGADAAPTFRVLNIQDIARPSGTLTLINGANNNVTLTAGTRVYTVAGPTASFNITGFTGGTDGSVLYVYNPTAEVMTLVSQSLNSTAANRIIIVNNVDKTAGPGVAILIYIAGTLNRWILSSMAA